MTRILKDPSQLRWTSVDESGAVLGYVYFRGHDSLGYTCVIGGDVKNYANRGDALLALSVKTDQKEKETA